jgi:hypothetical protein
LKGRPSLVISAEAGIQLLALDRHSREGGNPVTLFLLFWRSTASTVLRTAGNFLPNGKKSPKTFLFLTYVPSAKWTSLIHTRTARFLRAITLDPRLRVAGKKSLVTPSAQSQRR